MPAHDIVVVGASAGGVEALKSMARQLPQDFPAAIFIVVHFPVQATSMLPQILTRAGSLTAKHPADGEEFQSGQIYIAPPNQHMLLENGRIRLVFGPREHGFRPSIDPLFRSAAQSHGERVVGVILSGTLCDGAAGMIAIKRQGGMSIVQDPREAHFPELPRTVIEADHVDQVLTLEQRAALTARMAAQAQQGGRLHSSIRFREHSQEAERNASLIRQLITGGKVFGPPMPWDDDEPG